MKINLVLLALLFCLRSQAQTYETNNVTVQTFVGSGFYGHVDGPGTQTMFYNPSSIAVDSSGNFFVADSSNYRIRKITPAGIVSTFAGTGTNGTNDGIADVSQFSAPREVDIDAAGNVYVVDAGSNRIRRIN